MTAPASRRPGSQLLIGAAIVAVFWHVATYPFVQDDWVVIRDLQHGWWDAVVRAFLPAAHLLYRPVGILHIAVLYQLFGLHPPPYHVVALALHCVNSLLVARIFSRLTGRPMIGMVTAVIYGTAITVNLAPLVWVVGAYELLAVCFGLLALDQLMSGRPLASAVMLLAALGAKEVSVAIVAVLVAYQVVIVSDGTVGQRVARLRPHLAVLVLYAVLKALGDSPSGFHASDPYYITYRPSIVWEGAILYGRWFARALAPLEGEARLLSVPALLAAAALAWRYVREHDWNDSSSRMLMFAAVWIAAGLAPVLGLPNHRYAYYLSESWVPLAFVTVCGVDAGIRQLTRNPRVLFAVMTIWMVAATASNAAAYRALRNGEAVVPMAREWRLLAQLPAVLPRPPHGATLVFDGFERVKAAHVAAARVLYDDDTIGTYAADHVRCSGDRLIGTDAETGASQTLQADVYWFRVEGERLVRTADPFTNCGRAGLRQGP